MKKVFALLMAGVICLSFGACEKNKEAKETSAPEETEKRVSFYCAGDNLIHNCIYWQADNNAPGEGFDFKPMYASVSEDIKNADISYINQETILGGVELGLSSYPMFNSPKEVGRDMIELGFDVFSHATNHAFDKGEQGVKNTYEFYKEYPEVTMTGIYKKGEENIKIVEKNGMKIAFTNYTYHTNGLSLSENSEFYVPLSDEEEMVETIKKAKEMADFVVLLVHWGNEGQTVPDEKQISAAKMFSAAGCDVIIGAHPHAIQPVEFIDNTLVIYSLGNLISAQTSPVNLVGLTVNFELVIDGEDRKIENVSVMPVVNQYEQTATSSFHNIRIIPFDEYTKELADAHSVYFTYEYIENLINKTIDEKYLLYK